MRIEYDWLKNFNHEKYKRKQIILKNRTKVDIKIKLYQILRDEIKKRFKTKYTTIKNLRTKFNIINKQHDIFFYFFATSLKYILL